MKILFLTRLYAPHIGGVEKHVERLTRELTQRGHRITILTEYHDGALPIIDTDDITVHRLPLRTTGFMKKFEIWIWMWKNRSILRSADIIHCHDVFFWYLPFRFLYLRKKVYTTFHGYESYPVARKAVIVRKISEKLSSGSICVGDFMKKWYGARPDIITYGAVDSPSGKVALTQSLQALFFGRLDDQTSIISYLRSYTMIKRHYPQFSLTVIGNGALESSIPDGVKHFPFQRNVEDRIPRYRYIFVSRYLSILEALVQKRLVFAIPSSPIHHDYLQHSPMARFIVIAQSAEELTRALQYYIENPEEEKKKIDAGYQWAKNQTWNNMADHYMKLWKKSNRH